MSDLSMKPARDELDSRRPAPVSRRGGGVKGTQEVGAGVKVLVFITTIALGGVAFFLWQKVQSLDAALNQSSEALKTSQDQLGSLQNKVQDQDKSLSLTGDKVGTAVAKLDLEVRKLWDLHNKKNRPDIDKLQKDLAAVTGKVAELAKANGDLASKLAQAQADNKELKASLASTDKLSASIDSLRSGQKELASDLLSLQAGQEKLSGSLGAVKAAQQSSAGKTAGSPEVSKRVADIEADIKAINAHRQQINARLTRLDQDVQTLYQKR